VSDIDVGLIAGALTTGAWLPQLVRTWRCRSASEISWSYLVVFGLGVGTWISYGVLKHDIALIVWNVVTIMLVGSLMVLKFCTRNNLDVHTDHNLADP
jgi:MtN3 and saliva related transmembrane protein